MENFKPVPKPEKKSKGKKSKGPTKTVNMDAVDEKRRKQNNINRGFGKSVEREVAKRTGGTRVPASGAIKNSVFNLEGDVQVRSRDNKKTLVLIECKGTSGITPKGDKSYSLKKSVLDQIKKEAELVGAIPAVYLHWKGANFDQEDYAIIPSAFFFQMIEEMKELYDIEQRQIEGDTK